MPFSCAAITHDALASVKDNRRPRARLLTRTPGRGTLRSARHPAFRQLQCWLRLPAPLSGPLPAKLADQLIDPAGGDSVSAQLRRRWAGAKLGDMEKYVFRFERAFGAGSFFKA